MAAHTYVENEATTTWHSTNGNAQARIHAGLHTCPPARRPTTYQNPREQTRSTHKALEHSHTLRDPETQDIYI